MRSGATAQTPSPRLLFVCGKGGVGKTTVAAALAVAAAGEGRRTLVCELAGQRHIAHAFGDDEPARGPVLLRPSLWHLALDTDDALAEWLRQQPGGRAAAAALTRASAFEHLVAAAPGVRELVTVGKLANLAGCIGERPPLVFDTVVVDAPATGHLRALLAAPQTFAGLARSGKIQREARALEVLLADGSRTAYVGVTLPEDMAVREVLELDAELVGGLDAIFVNEVWPERFTAAQAERLAALKAGTRDARWLDAALAHHRRARLHAERIAALRASTAAPVVELPELFFDRLGPAEYAVLARRTRSITAPESRWHGRRERTRSAQIA